MHDGFRVNPAGNLHLHLSFVDRTLAGVVAGGGILLYGPPGCGKTMFGKAISTECRAEFISVGISDILSKWHGQSEQNLKLVFQRARDERPCVLFFDELDALAITRSKLSSDSSRTLVNEFLAQLDGMMGDNEQILFLGATNMPWDVDPAAKRSGRFSRQIFVPPPDAQAREAILNMSLSSLPHKVDSLKEIVKKTNLYSGAALVGLVEEAREHTLEDILTTGEERKLLLQDLVQALDVTAADTLDWLRTAENLVKFGGTDSSYKDLANFLKKQKGFL